MRRAWPAAVPAALPGANKAQGWRPRIGGAAGRAILTFGVSGLLALLVTGVGVAVAFRSTGKSEAVNEARMTTDLITTGIVAPALSDELLDGEPGAVASFDALVRQRVLSAGRIVRVKLWRPDGTIVYSDEPRLIGRAFTLHADEADIIRNGGSAADVTDISAPENVYEQPGKALLEVYERVQAPSGRFALFEVYLPYDSVSADAEATWRSFLPALFAGLVALELLQFPFAWRLARQLTRSDRDRVRLLERAADAAGIERRHIAAELHDTVVQDLAAQRFSLIATAAALPAGSPPQAAKSLEAAAEQVGGTVRQLREVLAELHPPSMRPGELAEALEDLVAESRTPGLAIGLNVGPLPALSQLQEGAVFRVAREALRNVRTHAAASLAVVSLLAEKKRLVLRIEDNGNGFDPSVARLLAPHGHLGMDLLASFAREADGELTVTSAPGAGSTITLEIPL